MCKSLRAVSAALAALAVLPLAVSIAGCGGGGRATSAPTRARNGQVTFRVTWPKPTRLIPLAANSIVVTVTRGTFTKSATLVKPANFTDSTPPSVVTLDTLEVGTAAAPFGYIVTATAFPADDGTGTAQATATTSVSLTTTVPHQDVALVMNSTITALELTAVDGNGNAVPPGEAGNMRRGGVRTFLATAKDAEGAVVLTTPGKIAWSANPAGIGTFSAATGNPITFTATAPGTTQVTATETESGIASAAAAVNVVPTGLATSAWAKFHAGVQNGGQALASAPAIADNPVERAGFSASAGDSVVLSSPVIAADGTVYVGSYDHYLYAFAPDGSLKWRFATENEIDGTPLITAEGLVVVGSRDGFVYAVRADGTLAWKTKAAGPVVGGATIDQDGYLYIGALPPSDGAPGALHCLDSLDGSVKWSIDMVGGVAMTPALNTIVASGRETLVVAASIGGTLYGVSTTSGAPVWSYNLEAPTYTASAVVVDNRVLIATQEGKIHAVNLTSGAALWETPVDVEAQVFATPAVSRDRSTLYVATFDNVSGLDQSRVFAIDIAQGKEAWRTADDAFGIGGFTSSPALSGDGTRLYLGSYDGKVYGVDTAAGSVAWSFDPGVVGEYFDSSPAIGADGNVYIGGFSGKVYAITR